MKTVIIVISFLINTVSLYSQKPAPPKIIRTTTDPITQTVHIYWEASPSANVSYYYVYTWEFTGLNPTPSAIQINDSKTFSNEPLHYEYVAADLLSQPLGFVVKAFSIGDTSSLQSNVDSTVHLEAVFDSCAAQIQLKWNIYPAWFNKIKSQTIFVSENNGPYIPVKTVSGNTNETFIDNNRGGTISIFVSEQKTESTSDSVTSHSVPINIKMATVPEYINADFATTADEGASMKFQIDTKSQLAHFELMRSSSSSGPFTTIEEYNKDIEIIEYTDNVNTSKSPWYYMVKAKNYCGTDIKNSNVASTLFLTAGQTNTTVTLNWNSYQNWITGIDHYEIQRKFGDGNFESITNVNTENFIDDLSNNSNNGAGAKLCYQVWAYENSGNPYSNTINQSKSNTVCIELNPNIHFEFDAFVPGSALNATFYPVMDFIPEKYSLKIFNRWGNMVFQSIDPYTTKWDGKYNGQFVQQGVYRWQIEFSTNGNNLQTIHGTVTVLEQ